MKHIGVLKPDSWVGVLNWIGIPLVIIYALSMFLYPGVDSSLDWKHVQSVWHDWQALNVGMLALLSSIVAFNISRFNANKQREREFIAARAFLPEALSELTSYFRTCSSVLIEAWQRAKDQDTRRSLQSQIPNLPDRYKSIFSHCITFAEPDVGDHLAYILMRLQVNDSRLRGLPEKFSEGSTMIVVPQNIISYMYSLAELQALVNKTFKFARGLEDFNSDRLTLDDFQTAYSNLDIISDQFEYLIEFTQRAIDRNES